VNYSPPTVSTAFRSDPFSTWVDVGVPHEYVRRNVSRSLEEVRRACTPGTRGAEARCWERWTCRHSLRTRAERMPELAVQRSTHEFDTAQSGWNANAPSGGLRPRASDAVGRNRSGHRRSAA
jgi:hypothetical protein